MDTHNVWMHGYMDITFFWIKVSGYQSIRMSKVPDIRRSGYQSLQDIKVSGYQSLHDIFFVFFLQFLHFSITLLKMS